MGEITNDVSLETLQKLQEAMIKVRCDTPPIEHFFVPGVYARKFTMQAGMTAIGKIHKHKHLTVILTGRMLMISNHGRSEVKAGDIIIAEPGIKRAGYALEETSMMNIHYNPSDTEDLELIEAEHIIPEPFNPEWHIAIEKCNKIEE